MARLNKDIINNFPALVRKPLRDKEFSVIMDELLETTSFIYESSLKKALKKEEVLYEEDFTAENGQKITLYCSTPIEEWDLYDIGIGILPKGYFCNLSAIFYHGLTNQVPTTIYTGIEEYREKDRPKKSVQLSDHAIFSAFAKPPRATKHIYTFPNGRIVITKKVARGNIGIKTVRSKRGLIPKGAKVAGLERSLIDAVINPHYNGGIKAVVEYFQAAAQRVDAKIVMKVYEKLRLQYPYWQALGFISELGGCSDISVALQRNYKPKNIFYVDHMAKTNWAFNKKWQVYYPRGLKDEN